MLVYDAHGYLGNNPEFTKYGVPNPLGEYDWLKLMDKEGITGALVAPPGAGAKDDFRPDMELIAKAIKNHPGRFYGYARVKPRKGKTATDEIRYWVHDRGFHAVKMNTMDDNYTLADRELIDPILETIQDLKIPVLIHTGDSHGETCSPSMVGDLASDFRDVTFIIGHMGYPGNENELLKVMIKSKNTVTETASVFRRAVIQNILDGIGYDRVLMGSNEPYSPVGLAKSLFNEHMNSLTAKSRIAILGENFMRVLGVNK